MSTSPDFEALFRSCPYPFLLMDTTLTVIDVNDAWRRASGAEACDVVGRHVLAAFPPDPEHPDSADAAALQASIEQVIRTRRVHALPMVCYLAADAAEREPRYWSVMHTPVFDERGAVTSVAQNMVEVTEVPEGGRRRADEEFVRFNRSLMDEAVIRVLTDETSHLRELFQQAPGCAAVLRGRDYVVEMVNDAYSAVVGHRPLLGKPMFEALPDLAGQGFEELLAEVYETGKPFVGRSVRMSLARGRGGASGDVYMDFVYQPIFEKNGSVSAVFMQGHEVTEALLAQQAQQAEEDRLRDGLDTARMAVWDWELDTGSIVLSANAPQVLGGHWNEIEAAMGCVPAEDVPLVRAAISEALGARSRYSVIHRFVRPDNGDTLWLHSRGRVLCDENGQARSVRGAMVDITERIRAESELERVNRALAERVRELAEAERRQAFQLEVTDHLRRIGDPDKVYQEVCQMLCRFLGVARVLCGDFDPRRNLLTIQANYSESGLPPLEASYPAYGIGINYFAALASGQTWVNEDVDNDPRTCAGETAAAFRSLGIRAALAVPLNLRGSTLPCLFVHHDAPRRWTAEEVNLVEDISGRMWNAVERVRAEQALRQADLRKDEFLAMLAHELRNPLAPISAAAELLRVGSLDYDSIRRTSQVIARQVGHMTGLVNDLLDVSRVTRGLVVLERKVLDIRRVVADAAEQVGPLIEARGHLLRVTEFDRAVSVEGDHKRLVQVLANLLANAAKYTPAGGAIGLELDVVGSQVLLRVSDNGIGIATDVLPHVFDLFAQAERTPDRSQGGLGLGLALVKSLVELHGGAVDAHSDGPGMGCDFTVRLPRLDIAAEPTKCGQSRPDVLPLSRTLRLMVVDDNVDAASMLKLLLEGSGHDVVVEHDALAALQHAECERFDAFLLDIGLPRMEGRELARRLRRSDANCDAMLVAVTGYGQQCDRNSALESGFDHYFVKPVDAEKLLEVLEAANAHDVWV
ncbi:hybrid sensor histidine kinase/response regulator [Massilia terrae]|uniref:histidine kinase n=1 Tax=Massilia terrae TaxID=1811224 RepID=A0ABT2CU97_9BURK|nr:PAS domain-containing protein [Massilia terrae]MCS0657551.1 PAS domain-containing protein [Massilia terrae]